MSKLLSDRVAIVTGANQGLGEEIARHYARAGASLIICARERVRLDLAKARLEEFVEKGQRVIAIPADVSRAEDVESVVRTAISEFGRVDILVNNAGVYGPKGKIEDVSWDEWMRAIEINLFGSVLMCKAVLPHFKNRRYGRIVQLSGGGATNPLPQLSAYAVSKAAIIRFVETLAEEVRQDGIEVNAIAPGALNTRMLDEILEAGPELVGKEFYERSVKQKSTGGAPLERGASLAVFLGSELSRGISGKLLSAVWDPWESLSDRIEELSGSDIYTLRRIIPSDRGRDWGGS
jgi:NAD(P)-dependent dehydrogenase (short-subunit alcohol dehydrogenase family)